MIKVFALGICCIQKGDVMNNNNKNPTDIYTYKHLDTMIENGRKATHAPYPWANHEKYSRLIWLTENKFHSHNFWEMFIVLKGTSIHHTPSKTESLFPGALCLLTPACRHYIEIPNQGDKNKNTYLHRDFYISNEKMQKICDGLDTNLYNHLYNLKTPLSATLNPNYLEHLESMVCYYLHNSKDFNFIHTIFVAHLLTFLLAETKYPGNQFPKWIITLLDNLNKEEFMVQPMKAIVASTGYSQGYVCRTFKKHMRTTLTSYIQRMKCSYSIALLENSDMYVSEIACRFNFSDESAYILCFKKYYGVTPGQWRKNKTLLSNTTNGDYYDF